MKTDVQIEQPVLALRGVDIGWGAQTVLPSLDLELHHGEILVVVGPGRSGKSTLLRVIEAMVRGELPSPAEPWWRGPHDLTRSSCARLRQHGEFSRATIAELLSRTPPPPGSDWLPEGYGRAALEAVRDMPLGEAPDPLRRFLSFIFTAYSDAPLLLFDEPLFALSDIWAQAVHARLTQLAGEPRTMIIVTHYLPLARALADRVALFVDGRIVESAPNDDFFHSPQHPRTRQYIQWGG